jgi:hypothetical protein
MPHAPFVCVLVAAVAPFTFQGQAGSSQRSLPPPTDIDAQFTEQLNQAARKLTNDLAVVSLLHSQKATFAGRDRSGDFYVIDIWRKSAGNWQILARYSTPLGKKFDRSP